MLCLKLAKSEQLECKRLVVGGFANTYFSILCLGNVKNVVVKLTNHVNFVQNLLR